MEDQQIIDLYWARSEDAIVQTAAKYGRYCHTIAFNILKNDSDSEECVNDTYLRVWNIIPPQRPSIFSALLAKITRNLALDRFKFLSADKRGGGQVAMALDELADCIPDGNPDDLFERKELVETLNHFLSSLPPERRKVFMLRYWYLCSVKDIAAELKLSESKVKMILLRERNHLRTLLEKEGVTL